jgi:hypothetical protein
MTSAIEKREIVQVLGYMLTSNEILSHEYLFLLFGRSYYHFTWAIHFLLHFYHIRCEKVEMYGNVELQLSCFNAKR